MVELESRKIVPLVIAATTIAAQVAIVVVLVIYLRRSEKREIETTTEIRDRAKTISDRVPLTPPLTSENGHGEPTRPPLAPEPLPGQPPTE